MAHAQIMLAPLEVRFLPNKEVAREHLSRYEILPRMEVDGTGEAIAEEMFDLTNNPLRQAERAAVYGNGRSVSTGDIVAVDGIKYLCVAFGWEII